MVTSSRLNMLSAYVGGRDNNFNLLRLIAAIMVLYSHSFALATGSSSAEPWLLLGVTPGSVAVDIFFVTSGFLVTGSLIARKELCSFVMARALRIYPAMFLMVGLTIVVLGIFFTTLSFYDYFFDIKTLKYAISNTTLLAGAGGLLPHVFDDNPMKYAVNGSLWTMPWEVRMYIVLLGIGVIAKLTQWQANVWKGLVLGSAILFSLAYILSHYWHTKFLIQNELALRLPMMFFMGAAFFAFKEKIYISRTLGYFLVSAVMLSTLYGEWLFLPIYTLLVGYISLHFAYIPSGRIRNFNKLGDYSYGVYIYAFPIQQAIIACNKGISGISVFWFALPCVLLCSVLSWHLVEKKSLSLKNKKLIFCDNQSKPA